MSPSYSLHIATCFASGHYRWSCRRDSKRHDEVHADHGASGKTHASVNRWVNTVVSLRKDTHMRLLTHVCGV